MNIAAMLRRSQRNQEEPTTVSISPPSVNTLPKSPAQLAVQAFIKERGLDKVVDVLKHPMASLFLQQMTGGNAEQAAGDVGNILAWIEREPEQLHAFLTGLHQRIGKVLDDDRTAGYGTLARDSAVTQSGPNLPVWHDEIRQDDAERSVAGQLVTPLSGGPLSDRGQQTALQGAMEYTGDVSQLPVSQMEN